MQDDPKIVERIPRHQGLVRSIAITISRRLPPQSDLDDLIAYGQIGLTKAAQVFEEDRGLQFSTYATYRIRGAILDGAYQMSWYNRAQIRRLQLMQKAADALLAQREEEPQDVDPLDSTSMAVTRMVVIGMATDAGEIESDGVESAEDRAILGEAIEILKGAIDSLPDLEQQLIRATYFEKETMTSFAQKAGKNKSWASRLHTRALDNLAKSMQLAGIAE